MFGKSSDQPPTAVQQFQSPPATKPAEQAPTEPVSTFGRGVTVAGKIVAEGTVHVLGQIEGEIRALKISIDEGAKVDGDLFAEELTIGGAVKGTIHANRVRLNSTAVVEGDIFHRSLSIEENARFEGLSKREDNAVVVPRPSPPQPPVHDDAPSEPTAVQGNRKANGAANGAASHDEDLSAEPS
jgi:cytoskeletal protein CcmA (bactofilin family)